MSKTNSTSLRNFKAKDLNNYVLSFEGVWKHKELCELFYKFLKKEFATESYDFIQDVEKLPEIEDQELLVAETHRIITTFLMEDSKREVNLPSNLRKKVLDLYSSSKQEENKKEWIIEQKPESFFKECKLSLLSTLKHDSFKRFIRTSEFTQVIQKYLGNTDLMVPKISTQFHYVDKDFKDALVTDRDFDFINMLLKDSFEWEIIGSKYENGGRLTTYWSDVCYLPDFSATKKKHHLHTLKYECILEAPFNKAVALYPLGAFYDIDPNTAYIDTIKYMKKDGDVYKRDHYISKSSIIFPFPLNQRVFEACVSTDYDPKRKRLIQILKPCADTSKGDYCELRTDKVITKRGGTEYVEKQVYLMFDLMAIVIEKLDDYRTYYSQIHLIGIGGWGDNNFGSKALTHDRGVKLRQSIERKLKEIPDDITFEELLNKYPKDSMMMELESLEGLAEEFPKEKKAPKKKEGRKSIFSSFLFKIPEVTDETKDENIKEKVDDEFGIPIKTKRKSIFSSLVSKSSSDESKISKSLSPRGTKSFERKSIFSTSTPRMEVPAKKKLFTENKEVEEPKEIIKITKTFERLPEEQKIEEKTEEKVETPKLYTLTRKESVQDNSFLTIPSE